jgi:serine protease
MALALAITGTAYTNDASAGDEISRSGARMQTSALQVNAQYDRFIVKFQDGNQSRLSAAGRSQALSLAFTRVGTRLKSSRELAVGGQVLELARSLNVTEARDFMAALADQNGIEYVEVDRLNQIKSVPNDTRYGEQWHYFESVGGLNVQSAWDLSTGSGVVVAVLDTGITNHSDLNGNVIAGYDFISTASVAADGNGRDSDPSDPGDADGGYPSSWHGTHVAGTIAAVTNNNKGVAGVAYGAKIQPVRVLGKGGGYDSDIADAIVWASGGSVSGVPANANPAKVINLSLGGSGSCGSTFQNAINSAVSRGTVVVIAAGNENKNVSDASPANCANVVAVAANDKEGNRSWYSNYGNLITVTAPGGETCIPNAAQTGCQTSTTAKGILSTLNSGSAGPSAETYAFYDGTSMATPHVAGVAALMLSASPSRTPAEIKSMLVSTARAMPGTCSGGCGAGIVDAYAAVNAAIGGGSSNAAPTANFSSSVSGLTVNFTDSSSDSDGSIASRSWNFGDGTTSTATNPSKTYSAAGTYTVTLTVTDNKGATNTKTASVTVASTPSSSVLSNGVPVNGIAGAASSAQYWTIVVPAGASNLQLAMSGGTGDADMYLRFGSQPTTSTYDCRPYKSGNAETCTVAAPQAGTYHVMVRGYSAFSGVSLVGSYSTTAPNTAPVANFSSSVSGLTVNFTDSSSDSDGSIASRSWNFGDGTTSTATNPSKTYSAAGTYTVSLTVTDNKGATNTKTASVTVSGGSSGGSVLSNGVPVTGLSGAKNSAKYWTVNVPAGATNLRIEISGGTGDADMYVRLGSKPTTSTYDCRPYKAGNAEACEASAPTAGTYHIMLRAYSAYSGVTLKASYTP